MIAPRRYSVLGRDLVAVAVACSTVVPCRPPRTRPSFVVFVADDTGFGDPGCNGGEADPPIWTGWQPTAPGSRSVTPPLGAGP